MQRQASAADHNNSKSHPMTVVIVDSDAETVVGEEDREVCQKVADDDENDPEHDGEEAVCDIPTATDSGTTENNTTTSADHQLHGGPVSKVTNLPAEASNDIDQEQSRSVWSGDHYEK